MKRFLYLLMTSSLIFMAACGSKVDPINESYKEPGKHEASVSSANTAITINAASLKGPTGISMIKMIDGVQELTGGAKVKFEVLASPEELNTKLASKQVDFATVPTNQAALLYNKTAQYRLAATSIWGVMYIVSNGEEISKVSDLKGKTILASGKGTTPDIALRYILNANNLNPDKDVVVEYISEHTEVAQKLIAGQAKIALLPEPFVTTVLNKKATCKVALDVQKEWAKASGDSEFPQTCLVVRGEFADKNPDLVASFLVEYKKSIDWVNANPGEAGKLVEKNKMGLDPLAVEKSIPRCNIKYVSAMDSQKAVNKFLEVILKAQPNYVGGKLPNEKFFIK